MFDIHTKKRIVIKLGTSTLTHRTGRLNIRRMETLVKIISDLENTGLEIILVSSGAIGLGMSKIGLTARPSETSMKQACAAVGQVDLMYMYDKLFSEYGYKVGQILLTKYVIETPRKSNVLNTVEQLLKHKIIPIVNENDTVAIDELELEVGENDTLAAHIALISKADLLIIMSDIEGLYNHDPNSDEGALLIPVVAEISEDIVKAAGGAGSSLGTGGMATKIKAAALTTENGIDMAIINGKKPQLLYDLFDGVNVGTVFTAKQEKI
ncbi:MAG: glutamate 5-kinase [Ruminococcus sp.]|jgi:glutamate 5-kinase|nr:glutamate 5-kinase [Ruminococcus sp.]